MDSMLFFTLNIYWYSLSYIRCCHGLIFCSNITTQNTDVTFFFPPKPSPSAIWHKQNKCWRMLIFSLTPSACSTVRLSNYCYAIKQSCFRQTESDLKIFIVHIRFFSFFFFFFADCRCLKYSNGIRWIPLEVIADKRMYTQKNGKTPIQAYNMHNIYSHDTSLWTK